MKNFLNLWERILTYVMAMTVVVLIIPVSMQIFSRFTDVIPRYIWTEELSRFCFIWMVMIGAMIGVRERLHFDVDIWPPLSPRADALLRMVSNSFVLLFAGATIWWGVQFTQFGWNQTSELADLPMWIIFIAWPLTGLTWVLFLIEAFARDWAHYKSRTAIAGAVAPGALV
jgi:TRAP-type transport system small permease protein